jgi:uncharacterized membrane protein HdeD (DUF308 family)
MIRTAQLRVHPSSDKGEVMSATPGLKQRAAKWSIGASVLLILAGVLAITIPRAAGIAASILFGWLLVLSGTGHLVFAFHIRSIGGFLWQVLLGILYFLAGAYLLLFPVAGLLTLTLVLAIYLFAEGVLEFILSVRIRQRAGWKWLLFDAVITLILAIVLLRTWPAGSEWLIGTLLGMSMLFSGVSRLLLSLAARQV